MRVDAKLLGSLNHHALRVLAVQLGVLVQDNPSLDVLRQRIRHCEEV